MEKVPLEQVVKENNSVHPRQRGAPAQRPGGGHVSSIFEETQRSQCGWGRMSIRGDSFSV